MSSHGTTGGDALPERVGRLLVERRDELTRRWLDRILARLPEPPQRVFPTELLLDHVPAVVAALGEAVRAERGTPLDPTVVESLAGVARLRREQGYDVQEVVDELELLGDVLWTAVEEELRAADGTPAADAVAVARRLFHHLQAVTGATTRAYREAALSDRRGRAQILSAFGRALVHELRNRLFAARAGLHRLRRAAGDAASGDAGAMLERGLEQLEVVADDVEALIIAQGSDEAAQGRRRPLDALAREAAAQLDAFARERRVEIVVARDLPAIAVDAARVELVLLNLLGNAIKYRDPEKTHRWVRVTAERLDAEKGWTVSVADNGVGVPSGRRQAIFDDFVRGDHDDVEGTGLGLAICRDAVAQLGGHLWLESEVGAGSTFFFTVPDPPKGAEG